VKRRAFLSLPLLAVVPVAAAPYRGWDWIPFDMHGGILHPLDVRSISRSRYPSYVLEVALKANLARLAGDMAEAKRLTVATVDHARIARAFSLLDAYKGAHNSEAEQRVNAARPLITT